MSLNWNEFANAVMDVLTTVANAAQRVFYTLYELFMREMGGPEGVKTLAEGLVFGVLLNYALKLIGLDIGKMLTQFFNRLDQYVSRWF